MAKAHGCLVMDGVGGVGDVMMAQAGFKDEFRREGTLVGGGWCIPHHFGLWVAHVYLLTKCLYYTNWATKKEKGC